MAKKICQTCLEWDEDDSEIKGICKSKARKEEMRIPEKITYRTMFSLHCDHHKEKEIK